MARDAVAKFLQRLGDDAALREAYAASLKRATEAAMVERARAEGYEYTVEELRAVLEERTAELTDEQLGQVAGGVGTFGGVGTYFRPADQSEARRFTGGGQ